MKKREMGSIVSFRMMTSQLPSGASLSRSNIISNRGKDLTLLKIEVSNSIILAIIDCLLGKQEEIKGTEGQRGLTEIELEVVKGIFGRIVEGIRTRQGRYKPIEPQIEVYYH